MFKKKQNVCMEIKDDIIRFVILKSIEPLVVKQYGEKMIPKGLIEGGRILNESLFNDFLKECVTEWNLKRKHVLFVEPDESVAIKKVAIPLEISDEEMRGYLYQALGESIILPFDEPAIDYVVLPSSEGGSAVTDSYFQTQPEPDSSRDVLLVATPDDLVGSYSSIFRANRLEPEAVDISPLCYYRLYLDQMKSNYLPEEIMLLQMDQLTATISIFEKNIPIFMQYDKLFTDVQEWESDLEMATDMQARFRLLSADIERILHFYNFSISNGKVIKEVILVGENLFLDDLSYELETVLNLKVNRIPETIETVDGLPIPRRYHLAIGLGLKGVDYYVSRY